MNMLTETMRTATLASADQAVEPSIYIDSDDLRTIRYRTTSVDLTNIQVGVGRLLVDCRTQLQDHVLRGYTLQEPFCDRFHEIMADTRTADPSIAFFTRPGNPTANDDYLKVLFRRLAVQHSDEFIASVTESGELLWNLAVLYEWLSQCRKLILMIMVLAHITSGQPARGEELACTTIRSSARGAKRGMYWYRQKVMLVQYYYKRRSRGTADRYVARFLNKELSEIVLMYLVLVRPFERYVYISMVFFWLLFECLIHSTPKAIWVPVSGFKPIAMSPPSSCATTSNKELICWKQQKSCLPILTLTRSKVTTTTTI
ncbi:hypothetical protein BDB00DRAFT_155701 [Zychaea mexicana]|uniref:uncharacterized protein n=1 Tax=Zychaea mexicana TaxID=64656 RepID=UPI0022FE9638|nr:uncharacterized protein BDB00DRAFT_155701 [Zychaea mexicana]KAI9484271.1 hypothetical protein BDB00DRAFT_155701 [Zychaea mexicana]